MSQNFHNIAYHAREKADLLKGVNEFLDEVSLLSHSPVFISSLHVPVGAAASWGLGPP